MLERLKAKINLELPIAIIGLGVSGESAYKLLRALGLPKSDVATYDKKNPADFSDELQLIQNFKPKTLLVSPGVPLKQDWIQKFLAAGGKLTSELSLATALLTDEKIIAVTGSVGKSTTVSILGAGAKAADPFCFVGGNLGLPLASYVTDLLAGSRKKATWVVLELSSYQLENYENLRSEISALVSLVPNHLERYDSLEDYYRTKWSLADKTASTLVLNKNGGDLFAWAKNLTTRASIVWPEPTNAKIQLLGSHNRDNFALAQKISELAGWPAESLEKMQSFSGLAHRLENISAAGGPLIVNDSKSTTVESVRSAVQSLQSAYSGTLHLLLGGKDKNLPWEELSKFLPANTQVYFFGECAQLAKSKSAVPGDIFESLAPAIASAFGSLKKGDCLVLSPGGTSFDEFKNFEQRGDFFKAEILKLSQKN